MQEIATRMREVDASGLRCPVPILRAKKALHDMAPGELLRLVSTDEDSARDVQAFVAMKGHRLLEWHRIEDQFVFVIEKGA